MNDSHLESNCGLEMYTLQWIKENDDKAIHDGIEMVNLQWVVIYSWYWNVQVYSD